jgi:hypothetical protein
MADIETGVRETLNGHQVWFSIDVQTFYLEEQTTEMSDIKQTTSQTTSEEYAKWYEKQLNTAFKKIK